MGRRRRGRHPDIDPTLSSGILSVILVIAAIIITLSFFGKAGTLGIMLNEYLLSFLFGGIRFATPIILLAFAWFLIRDIDYDYRHTHGIGAVLFFISLTSLLHLRFPADAMWTEALNGNGGGVVGMFAWILKTYLGSIASWVLLIGLVIVSIILIFNTSVTSFVLLHRKLFMSFGKLGQMIVDGVKFLFVTDTGRLRLDPDAEYEDEEYEEDDEDERRFSKRSLGEDVEDDDEEYEDDEADEEQDALEDEERDEEQDADETPAPAPDKDDVWSKKIIIRKLPSTALLSSKKGKPTSGDIKANAEIIRDTLSEFKIDVDMGEVRIGPTVTQYSLKPAKGVKLSRITALSNDLALALAAHPIRIEAPIPGQSLVGIEVPNQKTAVVSFKELVESEVFTKRNHNMMMALGKDVGGKIWFADLPSMPHLLIAGATGSGKTVCVNTIIMSLLYQNTAETLRMIMVDPKRVELTPYNGIPHLLTPVITNTQKTVNALRWAIGEMERRFEVMSQSHSRDISSYNKKYPDNKMPHIIFIIDELADLMATASQEIEAGIIRLAQMARAVGIHLILATQRPSVDVITGLMKANIPGRIAFSVASLIDSRTILDGPGAEKLLGRGDMLYQTAALGKPVRIQGAFISEEEVRRVVEYLKGDEEPEYDESIVSKPQEGGTLNLFGGPSDDQDPLFAEAKTIIIEAGKASASLLQRRLKVGYARAARILDELEEAGVIGPAHGSKPRDILLTKSQISATMGAGAEHNVYKQAIKVAEEESDKEDYDADEVADEDYEETDTNEEYDEDEVSDDEEVDDEEEVEEDGDGKEDEYQGDEDEYDEEEDRQQG